jgi:drug/metabolite transporter (DMT)-like permease
LESKKVNLGIIYGIIAVFTIGFQPIVANARPKIIDPYIFAALTVLTEAMIFSPIMMMERRNIKKKHKEELINTEELNAYLYGYKKNKPLLLYVGLTFGIGQILFFVGYSLAGSISGSIAQKSTVFFALLFGFLILHEKVSKIQVIFSIILFLGLILIATEGSFNLLELNIGVVVLLILSSIWMLAHTFTKPIFDRKEAIPSQMVVIRNSIGAIFLFSAFFIFFPIQIITMLSNPLYIIWGFAMGVTYGTGLFFWYKCMQHIDVNKASILVSPTPIATAIYAVLLLGEIFTIYHLIGTIIVILSIFIIVKPTNKEKE